MEKVATQRRCCRLQCTLSLVRTEGGSAQCRRCQYGLRRQFSILICMDGWKTGESNTCIIAGCACRFVVVVVARWADDGSLVLPGQCVFPRYEWFVPVASFVYRDWITISPSLHLGDVRFASEWRKGGRVGEGTRGSKNYSRSSADTHTRVAFSLVTLPVIAWSVYLSPTVKYSIGLTHPYPLFFVPVLPSPHLLPPFLDKNIQKYFVGCVWVWYHHRGCRKWLYFRVSSKPL